ncbi:hypothetical protein [Actinomadura sp. NTSP31]
MSDMDSIEVTHSITTAHVLMLATFDGDEYVYGSLRAAARVRSPSRSG